jgi:hypothetical protein
MSFELPLLAAARQLRVFKVVGRIAVVKNVQFFREPFFQKFTVVRSLTVAHNCYFQASGRNCMTHRQALQVFPDTNQASLYKNNKNSPKRC